MQNQRKNLFVTLIFSFFMFNISLAQSTIDGKLKGYDQGTAQIITGMRQPIVIGTVKKNGKFSITLDDNYLNKVKASVAAENSDDDQWTTSLMTLDRAFGNCNDGDIKIENGDQTVIKLSVFNTFGVMDMDEKTNYGFIMVVNSKEFARTISGYEPGTDKKGYMLDWYYFEEPATVKGSCTVKTYTLSQKEEDIYNVTTTYDLELKAGWNLVKFGYSEIHTDPEGKNYVSEKIYTTLDKIPAEVEYLYFSEQ